MRSLTKKSAWLFDNIKEQSSKNLKNSLKQSTTKVREHDQQTGKN